MDYLVRCDHCDVDVLSVPRIGDEESAVMRAHLDRCTSVRYEVIRRVVPGGPGGFAELLRHFRVSKAGAPAS